MVIMQIREMYKCTYPPAKQGTMCYMFCRKTEFDKKFSFRKTFWNQLF